MLLGSCLFLLDNIAIYKRIMRLESDSNADTNADNTSAWKISRRHLRDVLIFQIIFLHVFRGEFFFFFIDKTFKFSKFNYTVLYFFTVLWLAAIICTSYFIEKSISDDSSLRDRKNMEKERERSTSISVIL